MVRPPAGRALAVLELDDFLEQPHRRLMRQAVDQRHRAVSIFRVSCILHSQARAVRSARGMSDLLARFADLHRDDPPRPMIHLPGLAAALAADDVWDAHLRYADLLARSAWALASSSCRPPATHRRRSPFCSPAARSTSRSCRSMRVRRPSEIGALADRFGAAAMLIPDAILEAGPGLEGCRASALLRGCSCAAATADAPRALRRRRAPEAHVRIDRSRKGGAHHRGADRRRRRRRSSRPCTSSRATHRSPRSRCRTRTASAA